MAEILLWGMGAVCLLRHELHHLSQLVYVLMGVHRIGDTFGCVADKALDAQVIRSL